MTLYHYINHDVTTNRGPRIGASDIPATIPNPDKPNESLAGYGRTAVTVYEEKTGRRKPDPAGFAAEMGHWNEPKAAHVFLRGVFGNEYADNWLIRRMQYEMLRMSGRDVKAAQYQIPPIYHSVEWYDDKFIVHPDGVYEPNEPGKPYVGLGKASGLSEVVAHNLQINLTQPFLIEAKSARYWAARRRDESSVSGYDMDLRTWQGIPLKHYVQIQFQLAMFGVRVAYLPLLFDTSQFQVWEIREDKGIQGKIIDIAGRLAWHIEHDQPPKEMAMNTADIQILYPNVDNDFTYVSGGERDAVVTACEKYSHADKQEKRWKALKKEAADTIAVHLKDRGELRDENGTLARWQERSGSERVTALKKIEKDDPKAYRYLKRKKLIETTDGTRFPSVVWKGE